MTAYRRGGVILEAGLTEAVLHRGRIAAPARLSVAAIVVAVLLLLVAAAPFSARLVPSARERPALASVPAAVPPGASALLPAAAPPPPVCPATASAWSRTYPGPVAPPPVAQALQGPCVAGADESELTLLSNASDAGSRFQLNLTLPPAGAAVATVLSSFLVQAWATGLSCSVDQATAVDVALIPPFSAGGGSRDPTNWSIVAPAFALTTPGACVAPCANTSALLTIEGTAMCEASVLRPAPGGPPTSPTGSLAPGDRLAIAFVGAVGSAAPLRVYVNDSTRPAADLTWTYGPRAVDDGATLTPAFATSSLVNTVWGPSAGVGLIAENCPLPGASPGACLTYDGPAEQAVTPIELTRAASWNGTTGSYSDPFPLVATSSTTQACASAVLDCVDFATGGGTGQYPSWTLSGTPGSGAWQYGGDPTRGAESVGGVASDAGLTTPTPAPAIVQRDLSWGVRNFAIVLSARVAAMVPIASVSLAWDGCNGSLTASVLTASATLGAGPGNSSLDGVWSATFASGTANYSGTFPYWVRAQTVLGTSVPLLMGLADNAGPIGGCSIPAPTTPTLTPRDVTPIADGYWVQWTDPDPSVVAYVVNVTGAGSTWGGTVGDVTSARVGVGATGVRDNVTVMAVNGVGGASVAAPPIAGNATLAPVAVNLTGLPSGALWTGRATVNATVDATGGLAPLNVTVTFGDGAPGSTALVNGTESVRHDFGSFFGPALVSATATDAVGDALSFGPILLLVRATPLGVEATAAAGQQLVNISWSAPPSPSGPVLAYEVTVTNNSSLVDSLAATDGSNATVPGVSVWNVTTPWFLTAWPDGVGFFGAVVAENAFGFGTLPRGGFPAFADPAVLTVSPITATAGGIAPFEDNVSATVTGGTNDTILEAIYYVPGTTPVPAELNLVNGTWYVNATLAFPSPGSFVVVLHVLDIFYDIAITTASVYVSDGVAPNVATAVLNGPAYVGSPVEFQASVTGGSGNDTFLWNFGDGTTAAGSAPVHTFALSGAYSVLLTTTDAVTGGRNTSVIPVYVYSLPVLFVSISQGPNGSLSYDFRASVGGGSGPSSVVWSFGDGSVVHGANASHDYRAPGTYHVNVTATDPAGRSGSTAFNLSANELPGSGAGTGAGITVLDLALAIAAGLLLLTTIVLLVRRRAPPASPPGSPGDEEEDGEVTLT